MRALLSNQNWGNILMTLLKFSSITLLSTTDWSLATAGPEKTEFGIWIPARLGGGGPIKVLNGGILETDSAGAGETSASKNRLAGNLIKLIILSVHICVPGGGHQDQNLSRSVARPRMPRILLEAITLEIPNSLAKHVLATPVTISLAMCLVWPKNNVTLQRSVTRIRDFDREVLNKHTVEPVWGCTVLSGHPLLPVSFQSPENYFP